MTGARTDEFLSESNFRLILELLSLQPWLTDRVRHDGLVELLGFCDSASQKELLADLLKVTNYISALDFEKNYNELRDRILDDWDLESGRVWFVSANSKYRIDSSQELLYKLSSVDWGELEVDAHRFVTRYRDVMGSVADGDSVVIVEDFIGSGSSMQKTVEWFRKNTPEGMTLEIKVGVLTAVSCGATVLAGLGVPHIVLNVIPKAISDRFSGVGLEEATNLMTEIEDKLASIQDTPSRLDRYRFGFGGCEAMYERAGSKTPNNVFPVFWWRHRKVGIRKTVLKRP